MNTIEAFCENTPFKKFSLNKKAFEVFEIICFVLEIIKLLLTNKKIDVQIEASRLCYKY